MSYSSNIEGVVLYDKGPLEISEVSAYRTYQDLINGIPAYTSSALNKPGYFILDLPAGTYYLTASGKFKGREFFSYHGANPFKIEEGKIWLPFMTTPKTPALLKDSDSAGINGIVKFNGQPVPDAQVSLYSPDNYFFKGMGFLTSTTGEDGRFRFAPEPGEYVVVARKRNAFRGIRPLREGDLFCYYGGNPVKTIESKETLIELECYPKNALKTFLKEEADTVKKPASDIKRFREFETEKLSQSLTISGKVTDAAGVPMKGLYVTAYRGDPSQVFQMHLLRLMPDYMAKTDEKGNYSMDIKKRGKYCVVARELAGEAPVKGEYYGLYEGSVNHMVSVEDESVAGANVVVGKVMGDDKNEQVDAGERPGFCGHKALTGKSMISDKVLDKDTVWEGEVLVEGTVVVKRGVTLSIRPGTVVRFGYRDRNNDGIGDGEIRVIGRLVAQGTPEKMIRFTSARENPGEKDWSYLLFFVSDKESLVEYSIFEYAFSGIQVHFSKALIRDSVFSKNHEGIRFGRAELLIEHNEITENIFGIRHTRLEEPVLITFNSIKDNEVGIFLVPSNQNTVDFSAKSYQTGPALHKEPTIRHNNIFSNSKYNYRLGERQGYDILLQDNWWGDEREAAICDMIYDKKSDSSLGQAIFRPYLVSPVKGAGIRKEIRGDSKRE